MSMNALSRFVFRSAAVMLLLAASGAMLASSASAAEKLRVGKAVPEAFSFVPLDVGIRKGFFAKNGLDIESIAFAGDARMQQAMASDSLDIALGSGPAMAFIVKGSPIKGVAAMAGPPLLLAIVVRPDGPKSIADLKGKKISVSTAGSSASTIVLSPGTAAPRSRMAASAAARASTSCSGPTSVRSPSVRPAARSAEPQSGPLAPPTVETSVEPAVTRIRPGGSEPSSSASFDTTLEKPRSMFVP